jgi:hypothetical protein
LPLLSFHFFNGRTTQDYLTNKKFEGLFELNRSVVSVTIGATQYVNVIRQRAALTSRESEMIITSAQMTVDYIKGKKAQIDRRAHTLD